GISIIVSDQGFLQPLILRGDDRSSQKICSSLRWNHAFLDSKDNLQAELQLAHIDPRIANLAEGVVGEISVGISPDGVIEYVKGLEAKLQIFPFPEVEVFK